MTQLAFNKVLNNNNEIRTEEKIVIRDRGVVYYAINIYTIAAVDKHS